MEEELVLGPARVAEPLKSFFFPPRGEVARFFEGEEHPPEEKRVVVGARACDLAALEVLDYVFLEGPFKDPFYAARRRKTTIISSDCPEPYDVCFCPLVGLAPHPEQGFDLNLSPVGGIFAVEVGSERGEAFVSQDKSRFREASSSEAAARDEQRKETLDALNEKLTQAGLTFGGKLNRMVREGGENPVWENRARDCVECGACNFVCPTCHCFVLKDVQEAAGVRRFSNWDACLYPKFARVAGGANPRPHRRQRLYNRFDKKFVFFPAVSEGALLACTGCGRCVEACAGNIDIRDVLKELAK